MKLLAALLIASGLSALCQVPQMVPGAQAIYLLNEGKGTTVNDSSGNGYTGTFAPADRTPTWTSQGVGFAYGQYVNLPCAALNRARTIQAWFRIGDLTTSPTGAPSIIGSDLTYGVGFIPSEQGTPTFFGPLASLLVTTADKITGDASLAVEPDDGLMYVNNVASTSYLQVTPTTFSCSTAAYLGNLVTSYGPFSGSIYAVAAYPTALNATQLAQNDAYIRRLKGLSASSSINTIKYPGNATAYIGDSRMVGLGEGDLLPNSWPYWSNQMNFYAGGTTFIAALPGEELYWITDGTSHVPANYGDVAAQLAPFAGTKVVVVEGGVNDLVAGVLTVDQLYGKLTAMAASAHAAGIKVVASTVEPTVNCIVYCEANRQTLNARILAGWRAGTFDAVEDFAGVPVLTDPTNKDYFPDGLHEGPLGSYSLAYVSALAQTAVKRDHQQFWLDVPLPSAFVHAASSTQTINLLQTGPNQDICGIYAIVLQAFSQPGASSLRMSVGDARGGVTQYAQPLNLLTSGTSYTYDWPALTPLNGTVQATITSIGGKAAPTGGQVSVEVCVESY